MIQASNISLRFGKKALFEEVNIKFTEGNCYGIIGANGAGKSTFLKILSGELEPTTGEIILGAGQRLSVLEQDHFKYDSDVVLDTVIAGNQRLFDIMREKDAIYAKEDFTEEDGIRASELEEEFANMNGWDAETDAATLLNGLGIETELHYKVMNELADNDKVKVLLARALFGNPDILLLDEPTNHLDLDSIRWLEEFLINFDNTIIVVSHDRYFLNKVCTQIADIDYAKIKAMDEEIISEVLESLSSNKSEQKNGICAWNPLGFAAEQVIELDKKKLHECGIDKGCSLTNVTAAQRFKDGTMLVTASLPAKGSLYMAASAEKESLDKEAKKEHFALRDENTLETPWYIVSWNELGELTSLYDKEAKREVLEAGTVGNEIVVYEDIPKDYDAWNVESYYSRKHWKTLAKKPCMMTEAGEICAVLHTELSYESSVIEQDIAFFAHTRRIDFKTKIDWKEQQQLVKAEFHLDVMTRTAACEIPYGVMERPTHRNTSWQRAQFEMCAHRFVDLSEPGFGVALLNDGRYGHSIEDSFVSLTLLTSGVFPFPDADKGLHELTYALMPHMGDWREANVVHEAGKLNEKPILSVYKPSLLTEEKSSVRYTMCEVSSPNVIVTSVKRAEDESGLIVRMYESSGIRTNVEWNLEGLCPKYIYECDMMEQKEREVVFDGQRAKFEIRPFEIKTFLLV